MMAPVISQAAIALEPALRVAKLDTEAERELATRFAIRSIPTLAIFHRGHIVKQQSGATDLTNLLRWVKSVTATLE